MEEQVELYLNLLRYSPNAIFVIDSRHQVIVWNKACEVMTGVREAEILGTTDQWRPFYPERRPTLADLVLDGKQQEISKYYTVHGRSILTLEAQQAEGLFPNLGGVSRYISFEAIPVYNSRGELVAAMETFHDITEMKATERQMLKNRSELLMKHEQLKGVFLTVERVKKEWEATMDCLGDIIIAADENGRIKRCNLATRELLDKPYSEILGTRWEDTLAMTKLEAEGTGEQAAEFFHPQTKRWFDVNIYPLRAKDGGITGKVITLHDQTEIKWMNSELEKAYAELKSTQSMMLQNEKMASIGQLAAGVAHEINNPIGFISSNLVSLGKYVERLKEFIALQSDVTDHCDDPTRERLAGERKRLKVDYIIDDLGQLVAESRDGADRVRKIVQDLKSFSRVDQAEWTEANIIDCLDTTINIIWNEMKYKVNLKKEYGDIPLTMCYPQQLNQVFMNLLANASQAIETQGEITVVCRHENDAILVAISDTGAGIPENIQNRLFEPFFTTKDVGKGTGLGLSISYDIVKKHKGDITVKSELGKGTTFTVRIPLVGRS